MKNILGWASCFFSVFILVQILFYQPHFGLMDDATLLGQVQGRIKNLGFWNYWLQMVESGASWGFLRVTYPFLIYFLYSIGESWGPTAFFLINGILVLSILYLNAFVFEKILGYSKQWLFILMLCFPYTYDLFQHPSLQEKLVLAFGALFLWSTTLEFSGKKVILCLLFLILGAVSKASFCVYLAMGFISFFHFTDFQKKKEQFYFFFMILVFCLSVGGLFFYASQGTYTASFSFQNQAIKNLSSRNGILLSLFFLGWSFFVVRKNQIPKEILQWMGGIGILCFVVMYSAWGYIGYLISLIAPAVAVCLAQIFERAQKLLSHRKAVYGVILFALLVSTSRPYAMFMRLHDLGEILRLTPALESAGVQKIYVACQEGADAMSFYLSSRGSKILSQHLTDPENKKNRTFFFDRAMCPFPGDFDVPAGCEQKNWYQSSFSRGYRVVQLKC